MGIFCCNFFIARLSLILVTTPTSLSLTSTSSLSLSRLQAKLGASPVTALGVVADLRVRAKANPLRDGPVLLLLLGENALHAERLLRRLFMFIRVWNVSVKLVGKVFFLSSRPNEPHLSPSPSPKPAARIFEKLTVVCLVRRLATSASFETLRDSLTSLRD